MIVWITPMGKPRMTQRDRWKGRPVVQRYNEFKDQLRAELPGYELPGNLSLVFYIPMPKSWSKKKRDLTEGQPHTAKPDIDNLAKAFMDAFKTDDSHVYALYAEKVWGYEGAIDVEHANVIKEQSA